MAQILQHKIRQTLIEEKVRDSFEVIDAEKEFVNKTPISQALRSTIKRTL